MPRANREESGELARGKGFNATRGAEVVRRAKEFLDSAAPLARDMRLMVRERLTAGDTDDQAKAFLVARYGNFVLLRPPFQPDTWALWLGPFAILAVAGTALVFAARTGSTDPAGDDETPDPYS